MNASSSPAVYGSRGTFGLILITTKLPEKGQMKITYNGSYNFYKRTVTPELVDNGYDWTTSYLEAYTNSYATDPTNINNVFRFSRAWYSELERRNSDPSYEKWRINPADNRYEYFGNTNWYKIFYKDYTTGHQHNLSITGGTDKASYYVSGRFFHQDGIYNAGDERYNQYNVLAKGTVQATKWLRVENTTSFMSRFSHQPTLTTGGQSFTVTPTRMMNHQGFPMTLEKNPDGTWTDAAVYMGCAGFVEGNTWREDDKFDLNNKTKFTSISSRTCWSARSTSATIATTPSATCSPCPTPITRGPKVRANVPRPRGTRSATTTANAWPATPC